MKQLMANQAWRKASLMITIALFCAVGAFATTFARPAHAATQAEHCLVVLEALHAGESTSRVLSQQCTQGDQQRVTPNICFTHLMRWWADANHRGAFTDVCGQYGKCDSAGYGFNYVGSAWNDRISSFQVFNNCTYTRAYENANYSGICQAYNGDIDNVGSALNDHISSFRIASAQYHC
ncbi:MAG: hypothetical protein H0V70_21155 [Ktedonobacteraceae bacterium]|nr:hypothetical protein [Ktedonobacteraceae bacterium]